MSISLTTSWPWMISPVSFWSTEKLWEQTLPVSVNRLLLFIQIDYVKNTGTPWYRPFSQEQASNSFRASAIVKAHNRFLCCSDRTLNKQYFWLFTCCLPVVTVFDLCRVLQIVVLPFFLVPASSFSLLGLINRLIPIVSSASGYTNQYKSFFYIVYM